MAMKFKEAEEKLKSVKICMKCKARNSKGAKKCRNCNAPASNFRPKRIKKKEGK